MIVSDFSVKQNIKESNKKEEKTLMIVFRADVTDLPQRHNLDYMTGRLIMHLHINYSPVCFATRI